ncbi:hypothetical protein CEUSTIGMA_g8694.t1 [Chlamydomonas eustigma]|uniref:glutaredoxin-dependent peroxiredoxin n=1 Tax=Chlamydomonas eustigma TaxID=1157962 RepID=A0A250XED1_9CHLO|nr:hypothetical protein CEUSTIGMA_g8694.t1 [Chlamydomonas eustigma]|eukprot:GAX81262.1 hypothetical protein CEUSTIGMA_g8694.t1 [Chlamydomonas eustigma]
MQRSQQLLKALTSAFRCNEFNRLLSTTPSSINRPGGDVPAGHLNSDLNPSVCNIGLGRRRDLTLRQDLCLYNVEGRKTSLADALKGKRVILVGFPGGPVCTEKHLPSYQKLGEELKAHGVEKVLAVTVDTPEAVQALATKVAQQNSNVELLADKNGGLIRLLGVEIGSPDSSSEPRCQRFAAIVEDGILLKLRVEQSPRELQVSDAGSMLNLWKCVYPVATKKS